jgi:transcriptional regulator with XRE-family HTH domain
MIESEDLAAVLQSIRQAADLSLLDIQKAGGPDPSYLSRIEHGKISPRKETLEKIAAAIAAATGGQLEAFEEIRLRTFRAAGLPPPSPVSIGEIRRRFAELLQRHGLQSAQVKSTIEQVSPVTMMRVIEGDEPLEIATYTDRHRKPGPTEEVVVIPDFEHSFNAGSRAKIQVRGSLSPAKRSQLKTVATLVEKIIAASER